MVSFGWDAVRLSLHVLAACVWVGGQLVLAALVPLLRSAGGSDLTRTAARRYNAIAWPAFAVLVATGIWNVIAESDSDHGSWATVLNVKLTLVLLSGLSAFAHTRAGSPGLRGATAAGGLLFALAALVLGVVLAG